MQEPKVWMIMCEDPEGYTSMSPWDVGHAFDEQEAKDIVDELNAARETCDSPSCNALHERYFVSESKRLKRESTPSEGT